MTVTGMTEIVLSEHEFALFQTFMYEVAGIQLSDAKRSLVSSRLAMRLRKRGLSSYGEYFRLISSGLEPDERQLAIDLLTTNETYFFREPKHFVFLNEVLARRARDGRSFRVWSAACSSGEEPYSIAMVLADRLGDAPWEILASDLSSRMLAKARTGHYPDARTTDIPTHYRKRFCLKGVGPEDGTLLVGDEVRSRVTFRQINLNEPLPELPPFDLIFLRNVMIYFDLSTKASVVSRLYQHLSPGGHLLIGHSETLNGIAGRFRSLAPGIYQRPEQ